MAKCIMQSRGLGLIKWRYDEGAGQWPFTPDSEGFQLPAQSRYVRKYEIGVFMLNNSLRVEPIER